MAHTHHSTSRSIKVAFLLNLVFTLAEIIGGLLTNSIAILSDALHDFGDSLSLGVAWYLENYSEKDADAKYSYGYRRFSVLGAVFISIVVVGGAIYILSQAVQRLIHPEVSSGPGMVVMAIGGIIVNGIAAYRLRGESGLSAQAVAWHLIEDVLGWIAVLVVGLILVFIEIPILDPILSILLSLFIATRVLMNLRETLRIFLQSTPQNIDLKTVRKQIESVDGVISQHHTHIWSMDGEHHVVTSHIVVDESASKHDALQIKQTVKELFDPHEYEHVTIEVEYENEDCRQRQEVE